MVFWSVTLLTLGVGFLGVLVVSIRQMTYWRLRGVPSIFTIPVFGLLAPVLLRKKSIPQMILDTYNACPAAKYFGCVDFKGSLLVIRDPEIVKEICVKSFAHFQNHSIFVKDDFDPILARNLFSLKDDRWRDMRTTLSPSFTASKMKYMFQLVSKCSTDFVEYLNEHHTRSTEETDLRDVYTRYTNDVIATAAFGISVNSLKYRNNEFYTNGKDVSNLEGVQKIVKLILGMIFPKFMRFIGFTFLSKKSDKFFKALIYDTVKERDERGIVRPDMIHLLMQARGNDNGVEMTTEDLIAQAFIFFLAGFETSSRLMCFVSHVLSHHPEIQDRLREEVDTILAEEDGNITYEALGRMRYMDMVISETLRLYPPTPFMDRVCGKPCQLPPATKDSRPFTVDLNQNIWIPTFAFHRDPNYFPEPDKFDPERFSEENKNNIDPYTYMPFGLGPRKCIGDRFALMETKILIARLLHNFVFKPSKKTNKVITFSKDAYLMRSDNGFWLTFVPRKIH